MSKYEQLREQAREMGCSRIDEMSDERIDLALMGLALAFVELGNALTGVMVAAGAFAHEIGALDIDDLDEDDSSE